MYSPPLPNSIIKEDIYNFKERVENGKLKHEGNYKKSRRWDSI